MNGCNSRVAYWSRRKANINICIIKRLYLQIFFCQSSFPPAFLLRLITQHILNCCVYIKLHIIFQSVCNHACNNGSVFRKLGFPVSRMGYFVYANAMKNLPKFDGRLEFEMSILPYEGNSDWVDLTLLEIRELLNSDSIPSPAHECEYCAYKQMSVQIVKSLKEKH
ncbi:MAG: hypothetical protein UW68_C0005G0025 [Candidatus Collierbacteria bacterium GW2011_GWB1_44_6]|uniref:Uncharacterized protein n=1 Tax=Candidatus Collierbacteria bacterium GW2011_GWB1_44_6 TaxID=1618384 RepID=A0A0G1LXU3_9BACT|nr:MAG: hypothetical protein UW68_C0005G0025 [Candidatus Collierbacteria bacterium GW2011_GWB1_44_6]